MTSAPTIMPGDDLEAIVREHVRSVLEARPRGLLTDVDGTISPIAPSPEAAVLLPGGADLLREATSCFDVVAAISGRSAADTRRMVGVPGLVYAGNHGMEWLDADATDDAPARVLPEAEGYVDDVADALDEVEVTLGAHWPGMVVERKGVTGSVHVRGTSDPSAAMDAVTRGLTVAAVRRGLRVTTGRLVAEVRPPVDVDKGSAVTGMVRERGLRGVLYLGDDRTDMDAFRALGSLTAEGTCRGVAVAVLHAEAPPDLAAEADLALASVELVPAFLRAVLKACAEV
jgi:trehalose 6-phosphate phosphatase